MIQEYFIEIKLRKNINKDFGNVYKHFMVEESKAPEKPFKHYFPKYHNRFSLLNVEFEKPQKNIKTSSSELPKHFSDHQILRMLKVGHNAVFGSEVKDINEIK